MTLGAKQLQNFCIALKPDRQQLVLCSWTYVKGTPRKIAITHKAHSSGYFLQFNGKKIDNILFSLLSTSYLVVATSTISTNKLIELIFICMLQSHIPAELKLFYSSFSKHFFTFVWPHKIGSINYLERESQMVLTG